MDLAGRDRHLDLRRRGERRSSEMRETRKADAQIHPQLGFVCRRWWPRRNWGRARGERTSEMRQRER
nr:unnamed protein product [Digitaria exilis]